MCGILGVIKIGNDRDFKDEEKISKQILNHRGPDDYFSKIFNLTDYSVFFSHNRLSIIDLSANGRQPLTTKEKDYEIIYNGEIYNYVELRENLKKKHNINFKSNTDTEVLLYGWKYYGKQFLDKVEGMFAFAIFDKIKEKIYIVRDRFGIKGIYFSKKKDKFIFSSEMQSQLKIINEKLELNYQRIFDYVQWDLRDYGEETFFKGVSTVLPGELLELNLKNLEIKRSQWWYPSITENKKISYEEARSNIKDKFLNSVKLHLRSDVPLGVALSGGLDSSAIVGAVRKLYPNKKINTFSFISSLPSQTEEKWIDIVNKKNNLISFKTNIQHMEFSENFEKLIEHLGQPFGSSSFFSSYEVFKLAKKNKVTVILDGQGGDEVFGGYFGYLPEKIHSSFNKNKIFSIGYLFFLFFKTSYKKILVKGVIKKVITSFKTTNLILSYFFNLKNKFFKSDFILEKKINTYYKVTYRLNEKEKDRQLVNQLRSSILNRGLPSLLRVGDRMSMVSSIESRVPFLNRDLVEYCLTLPEDYLVSKDGLSKNIFRDAMKGIIPDEILNRKDKKGFDSPDKIWMKNYLKKNIQYICEELKIIKFLNTKKIEEKIFDFLGSDKDLPMLEWRIINLIVWHKVFRNYIKFC